MKKTTVEVIAVLLLSILTPFIAIRDVAFHVGFIFQRDSYPPYYLSNSQYAISCLGFPAVMDNVELPLIGLLYLGVLNPMTFDWINYLLFPFAISIPSMYWASRHFIRKYSKAGFIKTMSISLVTAFLYAITPTAFYFSHWYNYATFYATLPALIAGIDYSLDLKGLKGAISLAIFSSLSTTDPRGFVFTFFFVITFLILRYREFRTLFLSVPFYLLLNIRTFLLLFFDFSKYSTISAGISEEQLWLNYCTFPLLDSLRGLGLFRPLVPFYYYGNEVIEYIFSFALIEFSILGYLFIKKNRVTTYFLTMYLLISFAISSTVSVLGHTFILDFIYPILGFLAQTVVYNYLWIFLPTYLSEMVLAPLFLLFSIVASNLRNVAIPILVLVIVGQLIFSMPAIISGNYFNCYNPVTPPRSVLELADFLNNASGNVLVLTKSSIFCNVLPKEYNPPVNLLLNCTKYDGVILNDFGIEYVVINYNQTYYKNYLESQHDFKLVFNNSKFLVFYNENYTYKINSPIYLLFNYPYSIRSLANMSSINVVPAYAMYTINPKYVGEGICVKTKGEELALEAFKDCVKPVSFKFEHLASPSNFTNSISITTYTIGILNEFSGAPFVLVCSPSHISANVVGNYSVVLGYISYPYGGVFKIGNGSYNLTVNSKFKVAQNFTFLGNMKFSGKLYLYYCGHHVSFLLYVLLLPVNETLKEVETVNVTSIPCSTAFFGRVYVISNQRANLNVIYTLINAFTDLAVFLFLVHKKLFLLIKVLVKH